MFSYHGENGGSSMQTLEGKGHKRKVTAEEAWIEDCESEVSGGSSHNRLQAHDTFATRIVVLKTTKRKKLSQAKGDLFSTLDEEDVSTVTSLEVDEDSHQQHAGNSRFPRTTMVGLDSMDYDDDNSHSNDRNKQKLSVSTIVEIDTDRNNRAGDAKDIDEEEEVASPSTYVLSSGRQTQQAQPKVLTIDDEFEEYFRQLML